MNSRHKSNYPVQVNNLLSIVYVAVPNIIFHMHGKLVPSNSCKRSDRRGKQITGDGYPRKLVHNLPQIPFQHCDLIFPRNGAAFHSQSSWFVDPCPSYPSTKSTMSLAATPVNPNSCSCSVTWLYKMSTLCFTVTA